jgi:hypothetical protein
MTRRGRPVLGAISGLCFGLFLSLDLVLFGVVRLDNVVITILPLVGVVVVPAVAWFMPLGRRNSSA